MLRNKSFYFRAKFGAVYGASETKEYVLKNIPIDNRIRFKNRQTLELLVPKIRSGSSTILTQGNIFFEIPKQCHSGILKEFSYGVALQQLLRNFSIIFII